MFKPGKRTAAIAVLAAAAAAAVPAGTASATTTATACSSSWGVEVWKYANYGGPCTLFTSDTPDTHNSTYSDGTSVFYDAGTAENNYPWTITLCYDAWHAGPCQSYPAGPYSANLQFVGVGSVYIYTN